MSFYRKIRSLTIDLVIQKIKYLYLGFKYRAHRSTQEFDWNWEDRGFNRMALVAFLVSMRGGLKCKYLEIGCQINNLFNAVASMNKTGVDPAKGGTHRMTSDEFFESNSNKYDVVFIDGLHEYQQVRRDALNSLEAIENDGWIAFHDFLPRTWKKHHIPRINRTWQGDCWKLAIELSNAKGIDFYIIDIDHGVGLMRKTSDSYEIPDMYEDLANAEFDRFIKEQEQLPIISFNEAVNLIKPTSVQRKCIFY